MYELYFKLGWVSTFEKCSKWLLCLSRFITPCVIIIITFYFSGFWDFNDSLYLYTVEPCYRAPCRSRVNVSFFLIKERWEWGGDEGGPELGLWGRWSPIAAPAGPSAALCRHRGGAVPIVMLHCISAWRIRDRLECDQELYFVQWTISELDRKIYAIHCNFYAELKKKKSPTCCLNTRTRVFPKKQYGLCWCDCPWRCVR